LSIPVSVTASSCQLHQYCTNGQLACSCMDNSACFK